jgi:hypothetical protein
VRKKNKIAAELLQAENKRACGKGRPSWALPDVAKQDI